jgi:hypothetical protein
MTSEDYFIVLRYKRELTKYITSVIHEIILYDISLFKKLLKEELKKLNINDFSVNMSNNKLSISIRFTYAKVIWSHDIKIDMKRESRDAKISKLIDL